MIREARVAPLRALRVRPDERLVMEVQEEMSDDLLALLMNALHLDHVRARGCGGGTCVNPSHLEIVTPAENARRGVAPNIALHLAGVCARGHPRSEAVLRRSTGRVVYCKACRRERRAERRQ